jgi:ferredoxin-NADP reductase
MDLKTNSSIIERRKIAEKTIEISLKRPRGFKFEAGQYVQIILPELFYPDQRGNSRLFSIASSPNDKRRITIAFRNSGSGYKRTLLEAPFGYGVIIRGPFGKDFIIPKNKLVNIIFIAGGIGITPFLSMIHFATEKKLTLTITLLYVNKNKKSAAYLKELSEIAKKNLNFSVKNKFGRFNKEFIKQNINDILAVDEWFIAGPPAMVEYAVKLLSHFGVGREKIHQDRFSGY